MTLTCTAAEMSMLLSLLNWNEQEGTYYGNRAQWETRRAGIIAKIRTELGVPPRGGDR